MSINAMIDRATSPYSAQYIVKLFGDVVFGGSFKDCEKFVKARKLPLLIVESSRLAWRELD